MAKARQEVVQLKTGRHAGKWLAKVKLEGLTPAGHSKEKRVLCATQREAVEEKRRIEREVARGRFSAERSTLARWSERWLAEHAIRVKVATVRVYEQTLRLHLLPRLGKVQLGKLTVSTVSSALHSIERDHNAATFNVSRRVLRVCLEAAWKQQLIGENPVARISPSRSTPRPKTLWTPGELGRFLEFAKGHRLYALWHLAAATGLRRGELLGLRWSDLSGPVLSIAQQAAPGNRGERARLETPKSRRSVREVHLHAETLAVLERWRGEQRLERTDVGSAWVGAGEFGELIFTDPLGQVLRPSSIGEMFQTLTERAAVPRTHLHTLRHLMASALLEGGFAAQEVADRLGHDPRVLLGVYAHTRPERREAMAVSLSSRVPTRAQN